MNKKKRHSSTKQASDRSAPRKRGFLFHLAKVACGAFADIVLVPAAKGATFADYVTATCCVLADRRSALPGSDQPHFESPQFRQVMHPSIITTAAVLHLAQSCAPSGKTDLANASVCFA